MYEGSFVNDKKHGRGVIRYSNGDVYEGGWVANKREGPAIYRYSDGSVYSGEVRQHPSSASSTAPESS